MAEKIKLTRDYIKQIEVDPNRDVYIWDSVIPGFGLRVRPSGRMTFVLNYRNKNRRMRWITLGQPGIVTVERAREKAKDHLAGLQLAISDPADERQEIRDSMPFKKLAEKYLEDYAEVRKKPKSVSEDKRYIKKFINKVIGHLSVREIERQDILRVRDSMKDTPTQANRALSLLSVIFNFAEECGLRPEGTNPSYRIKKYPERQIERLITPNEWGQIGKALKDAEEKQLEPQPAIDAIRLLIFTGARKSEILNLRWNEVDLERGFLNLPDSKTGSKVIYLNKAAIDVLKKIKKSDAPWVIPSQRRKGRFIGLQKVWERVRKTAQVEDVRIHDLRHGFASVAAGMGEGLPIIGKLLGHRQVATTQRYAHLSDDPLRTANDKIGDCLNNALKKGGADVIDISPEQREKEAKKEVK